MPEPAIRVQNLSKRYRIGAREQTHDTFAAALAHSVRRPLHNLRSLRSLTTFDNGSSSAARGQPSDTIWALRDVSFEVQPGEVVGVIGRNGAGKSTLLKILSRITHPTSGRVELNGRVSSLLEVGTGFHPELTGRENIYLNGTILGMRKVEIDRKFDEIVDFSGVEKFIDTPVKRYSSGMRVRLAFSVAAHLEPEILLVDEVLAVGDAEFQRKCLGKMEDVGKEGRTIIFVSHDMSAVKRLCNRAILLDAGAIFCVGGTEAIVSSYFRTDIVRGEKCWSEDERAPGDETIQFRFVRVVDEAGDLACELDNTRNFYVQIGYEALQDLRHIRVGFQLLTSEGILLFDSNDQDTQNLFSEERPRGQYVSTCRIPSQLLNQKEYVLNLVAHIPRVRLIAYEERVLILRSVYVGGVGIDPEKPGVIRPALEWSIQRIEHDRPLISRYQTGSLTSMVK